MGWRDHIPEDIQERYEIHEYKHAAAILAYEFPNEFTDLCRALREFKFKTEDIKNPGGRESQIPKTFSEILRPLGWDERQLNASVMVDGSVVSHDTHRVDYIKNRVAFDLEWNSKDQTFDRDLYAFRAFFEYDRISAGVLVTRSNELDPWFGGLGNYTDKLGVKRSYKAKYGASTTQVSKLLPRLKAGRSGGCPVLVFGITTRSLADDTAE